MRYLAAVVQTTATASVEASLEQAEARCREAARAGAQLIALPEAVSFIGAGRAEVAEPLDGPSFERLARLAADLQVVLAAGSLPETNPEDPARPFNTSVVFGPDGTRWARYRKCHLFDLDLGPEGPKLAESERTAPGEGPALIASPVGRLGLSICYDLRFAYLYEALRAADAEVLLVPSAFTVPTGAAHWELLLRARAVETQCFVIAAAQYGQHADGRRSYGRSMIVDPWGTVLAQVPDGGHFGLAEIRLDALQDIRRKMPCETHRRALAPVEVSQP